MFLHEFHARRFLWAFTFFNVAFWYGPAAFYVPVAKSLLPPFVILAPNNTTGVISRTTSDIPDGGGDI